MVLYQEVEISHNMKIYDQSSAKTGLFFYLLTNIYNVYILIKGFIYQFVCNILCLFTLFIDNVSLIYDFMINLGGFILLYNR